MMANAPKKNLSTKDIFEQLHGGASLSHVYTGLIQEEDAQHIRFSVGATCSTWITIPSNLVERVVLIKTVQCGDHTHPLVHLFLRAPQTAEGKAFAGISTQMKATQATVSLASFSGSPCPPGKFWHVDPVTGESICA